jgi:hypothetical protein
MRILIVFASILFLSACETTPYKEMSYAQRQALAEKIMKICSPKPSSNYTKRDFENEKACAYVEFERDQAIRKRNRENISNAGAAIGAGFSAYGEAMRSQPRSLNCVSRSYGTGTLYTSCN